MESLRSQLSALQAQQSQLRAELGSSASEQQRQLDSQRTQLDSQQRQLEEQSAEVYSLKRARRAEEVLEKLAELEERWAERFAGLEEESRRTREKIFSANQEQLLDIQQSVQKLIEREVSKLQTEYTESSQSRFEQLREFYSNELKAVRLRVEELGSERPSEQPDVGALISAQLEEIEQRLIQKEIQRQDFQEKQARVLQDMIRERDNDRLGVSQVNEALGQLQDQVTEQVLDLEGKTQQALDDLKMHIQEIQISLRATEQLLINTSEKLESVQAEGRLQSQQELAKVSLFQAEIRQNLEQSLEDLQQQLRDELKELVKAQAAVREESSPKKERSQQELLDYVHKVFERMDNENSQYQLRVAHQLGELT